MRVWERLAIGAFLIAMVAFGVLVVIRSAFLSRPLTDLGCFLHAAWAVRTDNDIYAVTFNDWYYNYPPLLAILMVPLALPAAGQDGSGMLSLAWSAGIWYAVSVLLLFVGVHQLAAALEAKSSDPPEPGSRRWWALRTLPIFACLVPIGSSLGHGQSNLLMLALACAMIAAVLRGQRFQDGMWMAGLACIKIFPVYMLVYPVWRRDGRCLAGCIAGLLLGLVAIPAAVFGPAQAWAYNRKVIEVVVLPALPALPALDKGGDQTRADTLHEVTATDTQSFMAMIHNTRYLDPRTRPDQVEPLVRRVH
ncbi:MAG: DUF2029 domain-containing protein [Gemmataceae bacterium]|nr:DUF2029 domain-containing protein [Gemmataceae bacterium]